MTPYRGRLNDTLLGARPVFSEEERSRRKGEALEAEVSRLNDQVLELTGSVL